MSSSKLTVLSKLEGTLGHHSPKQAAIQARTSRPLSSMPTSLNESSEQLTSSFSGLQSLEGEVGPVCLDGERGASVFPDTYTIRIGFWGPIYYNYNKEPPQNMIGNILESMQLPLCFASERLWAINLWTRRRRRPSFAPACGSLGCRVPQNTLACKFGFDIHDYQLRSSFSQRQQPQDLLQKISVHGPAEIIPKQRGLLM